MFDEASTVSAFSKKLTNTKPARRCLNVVQLQVPLVPNHEHNRQQPRAPRCLLAVVCWTALLGSASGDVSGVHREEVAYLLEYIRTAACTFERNGTKHTGEGAYAHVRKKYDYFRNRIHSTESFIEYSATKSMLSGKHYMITCAGQLPVRTQDWLLRELDAYRKRSSD